MDGCSEKNMTDDGGHEGIGGGAMPSTSGSGSEVGGSGRDFSTGVSDADLRPHSDGKMAEEMELLLEQVAEVGRGLAIIKRGRRKLTNPLLRYSVEAWEEKLLQAEEARDKLNWLVTGLRKLKFVRSEKQEEDKISPFGILPEEVWEIILPHVVDSKDIESVLQAYPWLEGRVMKNKYSWLIDQVMPHIFPWLGTNDVFTCRQVCKRWNHGVDNFLENHPQKRDYDFGSPLTGQVWTPEASRGYYELRKKFRGVKRFYYWEEMEQFKRAMINHPAGKNVFVGRSVTFARDSLRDFMRPSTTAGSPMEILRTFGDHVWFIDIYENFSRKEFSQFCDFVFQLLSFLPNLKSFQMPALKILDFAGPRDEATEILELSLQSFPQLPQLETLSMPCSGCGHPNVPDCLIKFLVMYSSTTLKRLHLCPCRSKWMVGEAGTGSALLPHLTGFALLKCTSRKIVPVILRSMGAPKLGSLEVELHRNEARFLKVQEIVSWTKIFPCLHSLKLSVFEHAYYFEEDYYEEDIAETHNLSKVYPDELKVDYNSRTYCSLSISLPSLTDSVPSLISLIVEDCPMGMEFDFLKCFPNLQYLKIHCTSLLPHLKILCGSGIWEMLHKLKEITLSYHIDSKFAFGDVSRKHFFRSREEYEWLKGKICDSIPEGLFEKPDSILVRLERNMHSASSEAVPKDLLLTSGDYTVGCIQLGVYTLTQANTYRREAKWSRLLSWDDALNFLRKYGGHIKRLDFGIQLAGSLAEFYRLVFEVLSLLPNLKALEMRGFTGFGIHKIPAAQEFKLLLGQPLVPGLHHMEILKIHCRNGFGDFGETLVPPGIVKFLVMSCSETLKKLEMNPCYWVKIKDFVDLPSLVELKMDHFTEKSQVIDAFQSFKAPNLVRLDFDLRKENDEPVSGGDIISWLKYFPKLETCKLWIWDLDQSSWGIRKVNQDPKNRICECLLQVTSPASFSLPSLKSFRLRWSPNPCALDASFLHSFPNLEDLELLVKYCPPHFDEYSLCGPYIWERLPKLQNVFASGDRGYCFLRTRAQYESRKEAEAKHGMASILHCSNSTISGHGRGRGRGRGDGGVESNCRMQ